MSLRQNTKRALAAKIINDNPTLTEDQIINLIAAQGDLTKGNAKNYFMYLVGSGYATRPTLQPVAAKVDPIVKQKPVRVKSKEEVSPVLDAPVIDAIDVTANNAKAALARAKAKAARKVEPLPENETVAA